MVEIEVFRLVSQIASNSEKLPKTKDSTLQELVRIAKLMENESLRDVGACLFFLFAN